MAAKLTVAQIRERIRRAVERAGGVRAFGRAAGVSPSHVSAAMKDDHEPIPSIVAAVGYRKSDTTYERM